MNDAEITDELRKLRALCSAQQAVLSVLMHYAPEQARDAVAKIATGVEDLSLAFPVADEQREYLVSHIRELSKKHQAR